MDIPERKETDHRKGDNDARQTGRSCFGVLLLPFRRSSIIDKGVKNGNGLSNRGMLFLSILNFTNHGDLGAPDRVPTGTTAEERLAPAPKSGYVGALYPGQMKVTTSTGPLLFKFFFRKNDDDCP